MLSNEQPGGSRMIGSMGIELGEFDVKYWLRTTIKAQALADFVAEFTMSEDEGWGQPRCWFGQTDYLTNMLEGLELSYKP